MKSYTNLVVILILAAFSGTVFAGENKYKATENEELFGTWVNMDYKDGNHSQMMVLKASSGQTTLVISHLQVCYCLF